MLYVGDSTSQIRDFLQDDLPRRFLLIDDGEVSDSLSFPKNWRVTRLDLSRHYFNPLHKLDYRRAVEFLAVINAVFPQGENTLTRGQSDHVLLTALLEKPKRLDTLLPKPGRDPGRIEAYRKIHRLLLSDTLKRVLCNSQHTNIHLDGVLIARLDRSELGDFDAFVLGNLLMSLYQGLVIIPDFAFYAHKGHTGLIRQKRLIAGVHFLDEVPQLRNHLLRMDKNGRGCLFDDAQVLADFAGLERGTNGYAAEVSRLMHKG